ncbi:type II secretion system F family protein [Arenicella sp. 4NH20-0111]|uniref:type II secretion system F family protein n=1 Tax=Arenicella sp. 4NH20-0111 TaxID=3127648 RepID=UPI00310443B0
MVLLISALFSILIGILVFLIVSPVADGANNAKNMFVNKTQTTLGDLFLFIDIEKIILLSISLILLVSLVLFIATRSFFLTLVIAVVLVFVPTLLLKLLKKRRKNTIIQQLPDFLLNVSSAMSVGMGLNQAIELTSNEEGGPIKQEFDLFLNELRLGVSYDESLDNLNQRVDSIEMELVVSAMKISREVGGNLSAVLKRLSTTLRTKIEMEGKIKTLTAQGRMQGIVMVCLPIFIGIVLCFMEDTAPYMIQIFTIWYGWLTLAFLFCMLGIGYFFIRKIVNIDV